MIKSSASSCVIASSLIKFSATDRAGMERADLDYAARHRNHSAGWKYHDSVQEQKENNRMKNSIFCKSHYNIRKEVSLNLADFFILGGKIIDESQTKIKKSALLS